MKKTGYLFSQNSYYEADFLIGKDSISKIIEDYLDTDKRVYMDGQSNDTWITVNVSKNYEELEDEKDYEVSGDDIFFCGHWDLERFMCKMCSEGVIPVGKYIIKYWW